MAYRTAGENIAAGYATPEAVVDGWLHSEGHRANILNEDFTQMGGGPCPGCRRIRRLLGAAVRGLTETKPRKGLKSADFRPFFVLLCYNNGRKPMEGGHHMKRIALIEDDPTVREELALLLENEGYQVLGVTDFTAVPRQVQAFGRTWCCWTWASPARTASPCAPPCGGRARCPSSSSPAGTPP